LLQQAATDTVDSFSSPEKQYILLAALLEIHRQGLRLVKLGAPARRLIQMPLLSQARRWKSQHDSDDLAALKEKVARIPGEFAWIAMDYEQSSKPAAAGPGGNQARPS
jgi:V/A-type H+/Na+-transporting ATPase subunit A